jgi:hypothetical protein
MFFIRLHNNEWTFYPTSIVAISLLTSLNTSKFVYYDPFKINLTNQLLTCYFTLVITG